MLLNVRSEIGHIIVPTPAMDTRKGEYLANTRDLRTKLGTLHK